jgi:hypothetical protein
MQIKPRALIYKLVTLALMAVTVMCKDDAPHTQPMVNLEASITNGELNSPANAVALVEYNRFNKELKYSITYQRIEPSSIELFSEETKGGRSTSEFVLSGSGINPLVGTVRLDDRLHTLLMKGNLSIVFPSADYPAGEIKGYLTLVY